ncbi:ATP-binding protein [Exiguobacterium sp. s162]|uniref:sensor histidine kinase n=1 Tax=Exiguobacterium sp. s162 TaxID=2751276 RepID=UPI001BE80D68|nr:ATP-binding protein [Exiguobacterium sp. s162]
MKRYTIRKRIWITIWTASLFSAFVFLIMTFYLYDKFYIQTQEELLINRGEKLVTIYKADGFSDAFADSMTYTNELTETKVFLSSVREDTLGSGKTFLRQQDLERLQDGYAISVTRKHPTEDVDILMTAFPLIRDDELDNALILYMELSKISEPFQPIRLMITFLLVLMIVNLLLFGKQIIDTIIQPLIQMKRASQVYAQGDFSHRIPIVYDDEIGELADTLNSMAESLGLVEEQRKEFLANVSHELRTPLSYIRGYTEMLQDETLDEKTRAQYYDIIENETNRLQRLVTDLLDLAQLERDSYPMTKEPVVYSQVLEDVLYRLEPIARAKGVTIESDLDFDLIILGDHDRLEQVIGNLLDNALRYTDAGKTIHVQTFAETEYAITEIRDEGRGIPKEDLDKLTERFYRVNKSRTRKDGGTGLGLAIAKHIIERHEGSLHFSSEVGQGTTVTVGLPLLPDDEFDM